MNPTVYFADKTLRFVSSASDAEGFPVAAECGPNRDKILKILETHNSVSVVAADPGAAFGAFAAGFVPVEAAGGVVVNDRGEWLMIRRNGRWDLPKGHLESGERIEECAAREVEEETGVAAEVVRPLCETLHAYYFPKTARWELKRTHWYELHTPGCSGLTPQTEEGIDAVAWCTPGEAAARAGDCYPTVRTVLDRLRTSADVK